MTITTSELMHLLKAQKSVDDYLEIAKGALLEISLSDYLHQCVEQSGTTKAEIIQGSGLERCYAYQILNGKKEHPARDKMIRLAFGLKLNAEQTQNLLKAAGKAVLSPRNLRDRIILFVLSHGGNVISCDELLEDRGQQTLE